MRARLVSAPRWVRTVLVAAVTAPALVTVGILSARFSDRSLPLPVAVVVGLVAGLVMTVLVVASYAAGERTRAARPELAHLSAEQRALAVRASRRGPPPADPEVARAALRLAESSWEEKRHQLWLSGSLTLVGAGLLTLSWARTEGAPLVLVGPGLVAASGVVTILQPRRLSRRAAVLRRGLPPTSVHHPIDATTALGPTAQP